MSNYVRSATFALVASFGAYVTVKFGVPAVTGRPWMKPNTGTPPMIAPVSSNTVITAATISGVGAGQLKPWEKEEAWTGVLLSPAVDLVARIDTKVKALHFKVGDQVRAGDALGELDTTSYQHEIAAAEASLRASQAEAWNASVSVSQAKDRQSRRTRLLRMGGTEIPLVSQEELADSKFDTLSASSRASAASASADERKARLAYLHQVVTEATFRAPFDGVLATRYSEVGSHVMQGQAVLRVVGRGGMRVRFAVPEMEAKDIQLMSRVQIEWDNRTLYATVDRIAPEVESSSSTIIMEGAIEASSGLNGENAKNALAGRVVGVRLAPRTRG